ncbi:MAG: omptin family outer membrane protease [Desulfatiglans sp.]|jgi:outer membrane protease|nr:omptin family outer membrane protease [Thermodesulfobacteriota bacterium]MEE4354402.1 omptin family outer membrane protease [Desulfatiglans sp.]
MRLILVLMVFVMSMFMPAASFALDLFAEFGIETRYINGDSTFHISFDNPWAYGGHSESELEFPLNGFWGGLHLVVGNRHDQNPKQTTGRLSLSLLQSIGSGWGEMKDSDWIENDAAFGESPHDGKDLYTESDASLNGTMLDISYGHHFPINSRWSIGPMVGFRYHRLEYDIDGYRGIYWDTPVSGTGRVIEYEIKYKIPYVGIGAEALLGSKGQFQISCSLAYSDWVDATDVDHHLLRGLRFEGDCEGEAFLIRFNADWNFRTDWVLTMGAEYVDIDTSGYQLQSFESGYIIGYVNDTITSSYWSAILGISYTWFATPTS